MRPQVGDRHHILTVPILRGPWLHNRDLKQVGCQQVVAVDGAHGKQIIKHDIRQSIQKVIGRQESQLEQIGHGHVRVGDQQIHVDGGAGQHQVRDGFNLFHDGALKVKQAERRCREVSQIATLNLTRNDQVGEREVTRIEQLGEAHTLRQAAIDDAARQQVGAVDGPQRTQVVVLHEAEIHQVLKLEGTVFKQLLEVNDGARPDQAALRDDVVEERG